MEELVQQISAQHHISLEMAKSILTTIHQFTTLHFPAFGNSLDSILTDNPARPIHTEAASLMMDYPYPVSPAV